MVKPNSPDVWMPSKQATQVQEADVSTELKQYPLSEVPMYPKKVEPAIEDSGTSPSTPTIIPAQGGK